MTRYNFSKIKKSLNKLFLHNGLCGSAQSHADDIGVNGLTSLTGSNNITPTKRAEEFGLCTPVFENLSFGSYETALEWILNLLIDDGVKSRIHRQNLFKSNINSIGIGFAKHSVYEYWYVFDYTEVQNESSFDSQCEENDKSKSNCINKKYFKNRKLTNVNVLLNINDDENKISISAKDSSVLKGK